MKASTNQRKFPRGSEWRRWDLQVHTPESVLNNGFKCSWDEYVRLLFTKALELKIAAIGVTDYFSIDGYKKLITEYSNEKKLLELGFSTSQISSIHDIVLFPNIEFRALPLINDSRPNFHVIFSEDVDIEAIEDFILSLTFEEGAHPHLVTQATNLTKNNLIKLGERLKREHHHFANTGKSSLEVGMMNATVNYSQVRSCLAQRERDFKDKYIIVVPPDEDLSELKWNGQEHLTRKNILQGAHALYASNPQTQLWGLGKKSASQEEFIEEFKSLKPCIWGSDSHTIDELFEKNAPRYFWVKADPSFLGLRQIMFEPELRSFIGMSPPSTPTLNNLIRQVEFLDSSNRFSSTAIMLNPGLNSIIGGKSTGKSLLAYQIARAIDPEGTSDILSNKLQIRINDTYPSLCDFKVVWGDGREDITTNSHQPEHRRKITYLPQEFIPRLYQTDKEKSKDDLNKFIDGIAHRNQAVAEEYERHILTLRRGDEESIMLLKELTRTEESIRLKEQERRSYTDEEGLRRTRSTLQQEIELKQNESGFSDVEREKHADLLKRLDEATVQQGQLSTHLEMLRSSSKSLLLSLSNGELQLQAVDPKGSRFVERYINAIKSVLTTTQQQIAAINEEFLDGHSSIGQNELRLSSESIEYLNSELSPFQKKLAESSSLVELSGRLDATNKQLHAISSIESQLSELRLERSKLIIRIKECIEQRWANIERFCININNLLTAQDEIELRLTPEFHSNRFHSKIIVQHIDKKKSPRFNISEEDFAKINASMSEWKTWVLDLIQEIIDNKISIKSSSDRSSVLDSIVFHTRESNYLFWDWKITYQGDDYTLMSPGKKNLLLLKVLIDLSRDPWPIIIDQPEADLDNRSIFLDLVAFLKRKKIQRQIIVITHNPNVVVGADSECVIIADRELKKDTGSATERTEYLYVQGSLENSFSSFDTTLPLPFQKGIREHVCEILEGGDHAFRLREKKYGLS